MFPSLTAGWSQFHFEKKKTLCNPNTSLCTTHYSFSLFSSILNSRNNLFVSLFPLHPLLPDCFVWPHAELSPLTGLQLQIPTYPGAQMLCSRINFYFLHSTKETGLFSEQHNPWCIVSYGSVPGLWFPWCVLRAEVIRWHFAPWGRLALLVFLLYPVACCHHFLASTTSLYQCTTGFPLFPSRNTLTSLHVPHVCVLLPVPSCSLRVQQKSYSSLHVLCHCSIPQIFVPSKSQSPLILIHTSWFAG